MITEGISKALADLRAAGCDADADRLESALTKAEAVHVATVSENNGGGSSLNWTYGLFCGHPFHSGLATPQPPQPAGDPCAVCKGAGSVGGLLRSPSGDPQDDYEGEVACTACDASGVKPAGAVPDPLDAAIAKGTKAWTGVPDSFVEDLRGEGAGRADAAPASKWFGPDKDGEMYVQTGDRWWKARPTTVGGAGRFPSDAAAEEFIDRHKHLIGALKMIDHGKLIALADQIGLSAETAQANSGSVNWRTLRRYEEALRAIANPAPAPQPMTTQGEAVANHAECCAISGGDPARCDCVKPRHARIPSPEFEEWFRAIWGGSDDIPVPEYQSEGWNEYIAKRQLALGAWEAALTGSQP